MWRSVFAVVLFATAAVPVAAQQQYYGTLGIYDDAACTQTSGTMDGPLKDVYIGYRWDNAVSGFTGFEFAVAGLEAFQGTLLHWEIDPNVVIGSIAAPTDTVAGTGGINVAWPYCVTSAQAFLRLSLIAVVPPQDQVLRIVRHYPPSNPSWSFPMAVPCDIPCFCVYRPRPGSYVLNPGVAVEPRSWGAIKQIYR